jgi:hypothetical protein
MVVKGNQQNEWEHQENHFGLKQLYDIIECSMIQVVQLNGIALTCDDGSLIQDPLMILDEEGKLKQQEVNLMATHLFRIAGINDVAVGTVVICDERLLQ